ncbi:MAG TPA: type II toxin-antitoxin system HipA family toxin [Acidimicrobiales bacterium]|jgi:serine/threonine-protein kinase HipA
MSRQLTVILDNQVAGTLSQLDQGRLRFDYHDDYRIRPDATPLSVCMPTQVASHSDRAITPWLWGLLPDNEAVLSRWARQFHVSTSSPFSLLSTPVGEDCAGAVRFAAPDELDRVLKRPGTVTWLTEDDVAQRLRELREDSTAWLGRTFTGRFSLAGAQAKTALLCEDGRWGFPSGTFPTTHILKPAVLGLDDHDLNEHLCLDAARRCGLLVARTRVAQFAGESAIVVDRYDRLNRDGSILRIHQEDLCQALGVPPSRKYQNEGGPGPADIAHLVRRVMPPRIADATVARFADALIWNWVVGGTDGHAKNYSLLLAGNQIRLGPLYDIASALPYGTHEKKLRLAMTIGDDYRVYPWRNSWPAAARDLGLDADALMTRVDELTARAPDAVRDAAGAEVVKGLDRELPEKLVSLIADRAGRCRAAVGLPGAT